MKKGGAQRKDFAVWKPIKIEGYGTIQLFWNPQAGSTSLVVEATLQAPDQPTRLFTTVNPNAKHYTQSALAVLDRITALPNRKGKEFSRKPLSRAYVEYFSKSLPEGHGATKFIAASFSEAAQLPNPYEADKEQPAASMNRSTEKAESSPAAAVARSKIPEGSNLESLGVFRARPKGSIEIVQDPELGPDGLVILYKSDARAQTAPSVYCIMDIDGERTLASAKVASTFAGSKQKALSPKFMKYFCSELEAQGQKQALSVLNEAYRHGKRTQTALEEFDSQEEEGHYADDYIAYEESFAAQDQSRPDNPFAAAGLNQPGDALMRQAPVQSPGLKPQIDESVQHAIEKMQADIQRLRQALEEQSRENADLKRDKVASGKLLDKMDSRIRTLQDENDRLSRDQQQTKVQLLEALDNAGGLREENARLREAIDDLKSPLQTGDWGGPPSTEDDLGQGTAGSSEEPPLGPHTAALEERRRGGARGRIPSTSDDDS